MQNSNEPNTKKHSKVFLTESDEAEVQHKLRLFRTNLMTLRKKQDLPQDCFDVDEENLRQATISKIENGKQIPSLKQAILLSQMLKVSLGDMLSEDYAAFSRHTKENYPGDTIRGRRPPVDPQTLDRFENSQLYCYYFSGSGTASLREGQLTLRKRCGGKGLFIAGELKTHSQVYGCKIVIEHPSYIFIYGNNHNIPERAFIVIQEPRYTKQPKPYIGGIGIAVSESSNQVPLAQKIIFSKSRLSIDKYYDVLSEFLQISTADKYGFELESDADNKFYNWLKDQNLDT